MYERKFRQGLKQIIIDRCLKQNAIAKKANIRPETLSRIINGNRRIFADEMASICAVIDMTVEEVMEYVDIQSAQEQ